MPFHPDITMIDLIGKLIAFVGGMYVCINLFFDHKAQTRRSYYQNPQIDSKSKWFTFVLLIDLLVGLFLLSLGIFDVNYPFGRVVSICFGYYCFNASVSIFQASKDNVDSQFTAKVYLCLGLIIMCISMFTPMSLTDFLELMGDDYDPAI
jgi:hypothetical protein